ncbi:MAG: hypothetical protein GWN29_13210 [Gammaproteobacteria bacterium]|nr:hypothetical protein [Gammaproteobacteria bacterium]
MKPGRHWIYVAVALLGAGAMAQTPVNVVNSPGVTVENTPGVVLMNVPGVTIQNDSETPVAVSVEENVDNEPQGLVEFRIVGYTITRTAGLIEADSRFGPLTGYAAMHELCQQQVRGSARAAFSSEAVLPAAPLVGQVDRAWIIPAPSLFDYTDPAAISRISCDWYETIGSSVREETPFSTGLVFAPASGRISNAICETALPVACSAPVAVPVQ